MRADYSVHNNKWSKLWNSVGLGANTTGATGINFAYLRYADVLLMFAAGLRMSSLVLPRPHRKP
jgi:hypothetical protein